MQKFFFMIAFLINTYSNNAQGIYANLYDSPITGTSLNINKEGSINELLLSEIPVKTKNESYIKESEINWEARCFCKISYHNLTNKESATGVCLDLTSTVNTTFGGLKIGAISSFFLIKQF